jgi:hypothetical protein
MSRPKPWLLSRPESSMPTPCGPTDGKSLSAHRPPRPGRSTTHSFPHGVSVESRAAPPGDSLASSPSGLSVRRASETTVVIIAGGTATEPAHPAVAGTGKRSAADGPLSLPFPTVRPRVLRDSCRGTGLSIPAGRSAGRGAGLPSTHRSGSAGGAHNLARSHPALPLCCCVTN